MNTADKKNILVVDDSGASSELLREILSSEGWAVETAKTPEKALILLNNTKFDLVISDINLEADLSGLDLLKRLREKSPVILVTGCGSLETAVEAAREGAWDFISKPFDVEEIVATARRALEQKADETDETGGESFTPGSMVGRSPKMIELYKEIARVAPTRSTVLILGESGTGKELVARTIHQNSPRKDKPLLAERFLQKARENTGKEHLKFSADLLQSLTTYLWKGNVRELEAAIEYAAMRARGNEILPEDLPVKVLSEDFKKDAEKFHLTQLYGDLPTFDELEKRYLLHVLEKTGGNRTRASEIVGVDRRTLYRMAERFGITLN